MIQSALLSLGSNMHDKVGFVQSAAREIAALSRTSKSVHSALYSSEPWGKADQQLFVNSCMVLSYDGTVYELLEDLQAIESRIGTKAQEQWGEREIDIDIVLCDQMQVSTGDLTIPHAHFRERRFVLQPAAQIAPELVDPVTGQTIGQLLEHCTDSLTVFKL